MSLRSLAVETRALRAAGGTRRVSEMRQHDGQVGIELPQMADERTHVHEGVRDRFVGKGADVQIELPKMRPHIAHDAQQRGFSEPHSPWVRMQLGSSRCVGTPLNVIAASSSQCVYRVA